MQSEKVFVSEALKKEVVELQKLGKTVPMLSVDGNAIGYIVISDKIKETSKQAIEELQSLGIDVVMLTGDVRTSYSIHYTKLYDSSNAKFTGSNVYGKCIW